MAHSGVLVNGQLVNGKAVYYNATFTGYVVGGVEFALWRDAVKAAYR